MYWAAMGTRMPTTLKDIRRSALTMLGDLIVCTATADGSDVTFHDQINLPGSVNTYAGRMVLFTDGTEANIGEIRNVLSSNPTQRALGFGYALPADTMIGDELEMIRTDGVGYTFQDIARNINQAITNIARRYLEPAEDSDQTFTYGSSMTIPTEYRSVEGVFRIDSQNGSETWHMVPKAMRPQGYGWWINRADRSMNITGKIGVALSGMTIRLTGLQSPSLLYDDEDETTVDPAYLVKAVEALAARGRWMRNNNPAAERAMYILEQQAHALEPMSFSSRSPWSELL